MLGGRILEGSENDRVLLENVKPAGWVNPKGGRYHLVVVGGGTGGLVTSAIAAALGAKVALIEREMMGGDCLNVGCVPSKGVLAAARGGADAFAAGMERMRAVRAEISAHDSAVRFRELGVDVYLGEGVFTSGDTLRVADRQLQFRRAVIATGTRPAVPPITGLEDAGFHTNESIFSLTERPERLVVIGGGPIGCELAQAFAGFGTRVTILEGAPRILSNEDPEAAEVIDRALRALGVEIVCGADVQRVERDGTVRRIAYDGGEAITDEVLVAIGRVPNVEGIGLESAGVGFDPRGGVEVDNRLRTSNSSIYAVGDVASALRFTHLADAHARMVVRNALFFGRGKVEDLVVPWCTYTTPELAHVGVPYPELQKRGSEVETVTVRLAEIDRAKLDGNTHGFLRVHLQAGTDTILAATLVAPHAGDMISIATQAMRTGAGLGSLSDTLFAYPSYAEIFRKAADQWRRRKLTSAAKKGFGVFFKVWR